VVVENERQIYNLSTFKAHISSCIAAKLKNYMRFGKDFLRASI